MCYNGDRSDNRNNGWNANIIKDYVWFDNIQS